MTNPRLMTLEELQEQARAIRLMRHIHRRHEAIIGRPVGAYDRAAIDVVASEVGDADFIAAVRSIDRRVRTRTGALKVLTTDRSPTNG